MYRAISQLDRHRYCQQGEQMAGDDNWSKFILGCVDLSPPCTSEECGKLHSILANLSTLKATDVVIMGELNNDRSINRSSQLSEQRVKQMS